MATFVYTARDKKGLVTKGSLYAADRQAAAANLIEKGLAPILVKEDGGKSVSSPLSLNRFFKTEKIKLTDKVVFSRQLSTMINAGVPIAQSLGILQEQTNSHNMKKIMADLAKKVQSGTTLSAAMAAHPQAFPPVYINMIKAGETGGILDKVLERLADQQEKDADLVGKVRGAMIYPIVVVTVTVTAFFFMMTVIVPKLAGVFSSFGASLPPYTRFLLATSQILTHDAFYIVIITAAAVFAFTRWIKTKTGRYTWHSVLIRLPLFGSIMRKVNIARFARTFSSLMASGISVLEALSTTGATLGNAVYAKAVTNMAQDVKNGKPLNVPLRNSKIFPPIVAQMTSVGEETGQLAEILLKVAEFYEKEVDNVVSNITSVVEPALIICIGGMVGSIVIGILGPLGSLTSQVN